LLNITRSPTSADMWAWPMTS